LAFFKGLIIRYLKMPLFGPGGNEMLPLGRLVTGDCYHGTC
jgi:hypothetical protein